MLAELHNYIEGHHLIRQNDRVLLAVSGGIDSMVMAHLFGHLPYNIGIAHCNFSLRGKESDLDEELVSNFSEKNKIPFFRVRFDTKSYADEKGISVQMAARELRYQWFEKIREENGFDLIAVAHNKNDSAETMLINLVRGTGLAGISGMKPISGRIIRPQLFATRDEIEKYCKAHKIIFREDSSNAEVKYTRNKIRHKILPVLQEINPSVFDTLSESAERFNDLNEIVSNYISSLRSEISYMKEDSIIFDLKKLKNHENNRTILFELFRPFGINSQMINDLLNILQGISGSQVFTGTHRIIKNRDEIIVTDPDTGKEFHTNVNDITGFPAFIAAEYMNVSDSFIIPKASSVACLDSGILKFPVTIRRWNTGDFFHPLGMNQKKKLSDYFVDRKYSLTEKEKKLVLESDGKIAWIIGDRIDDRFKITSETKQALILRYR